LGHTGCDWGRAGPYSLDKDLLATIGQEASDPGQDVTSDTVVAQLHSKMLVWDLIERLAEVQQIILNGKAVSGCVKKNKEQTCDNVSDVREGPRNCISIPESGLTLYYVSRNDGNKIITCMNKSVKLNS